MEATPLKLIGVISTAVLSLTLGVAAPAYAQQEQRDQQEEQKAKPAQQEEKKAQPAAKQEEKNAQQQDKNTKQEEKNTQQQNKNTKSAERNTQQQDKNAKQEEKNAQQQHTQQAKPGQQAQHASGGRIPDDRFKANFGREHSFHVSQADYSSHRFRYGGYAFGFIDPWPSNWLYTQDVFVIEINGVYYLCNPMYPGVNIALSFEL
jgi:outer membrane biosynthesis protein TonB